MNWIRLVLCLGTAAAMAGGPFLGAQRRTIPQPAYFKAFEAYEIKENMTHVRLRNGLTIVIEEDTLDPLASVVTFVKAGYAHQNPDAAGVALLLERAFLYASDLPERADRLGGLLEIDTAADSTVLSSSGPADSVREMVEIHAQMIQGPQFSPEAISREIRIIQGEASQAASLASPQGRLAALTYPEQQGLLPAGDLPGWMKSEEGAHGTLSAFHRRYYHPRNVILSVAGTVRREEILEKVVELYGSLSSPEEAESPWDRSVNAPSGAGFQYVHVREDLQAPKILMAYRVPGFEHPDYYPLLLLSQMLRGRGGLLQSLIEEGSAARLETRLDIQRERGTFLVAVQPDPERVDHAEVGVLAQLEALRRNGVPIAALDRAKALVLKEHYRQLQSLPGRARLLAQFEAAGGYLGRDRLAQQLQEISPGALNRALGRYFAEGNLSLLEYFPRQAEQRTFTPESLMETLRLLVPTVVQKKREDLESLDALQARSTFQPPEFVPTYLKRELKRTSILRGPEIYFEEDHRVPLVHLGFFYSGGRIEESEENAGVTELMLRTVLRNLGSKETGFWTELEQRGVEIEVVNEWEFFGYRVTVASSHLNEIFGLLIEWLRQPNIAEADLQLARKQVLSELAAQKEDEFLSLRHLTQKQFFGQHPYGLNRFGSAESVQSVNLESLRGWMLERMVAVHPLIMARGDITGTTFLQNFISTLSDPRFEAPKFSRKRSTEDEGSRWKPAFAQVAGNLGAAFPVPPRTSRDEALLEIFKGVLVGPSGRLTASLRNETEAAYGVQISHQAGLQGGVVFVRLRTAPGQEERAREALMNELEKLETEPLRTRRFPDILVGAITRFYLKRSIGEENLLEVIRKVQAGADVGYEERYLSRVKNARPDDFMLLTRDYFTEVTVVEPPAEEDKPPEEVEEEQAPEPEEESRPRPTLRREGEPR